MACHSAFAAGKAEIFVEPVVGAEDGFSLAQGQSLGAALSEIKNPACKNRTDAAVGACTAG